MKNLWSKLQDPVIRAARTFLQTATGTWLTITAVSQLERFDQLADVGAIEISIVAGAVSVVTLVHNMLEQAASTSYNRG